MSEPKNSDVAQQANERNTPEGYIQQYNERGHPESRESRTKARELRQAKNHVLSTVGLVCKSSAQSLEKKDVSQGIKTAESENEVGTLVFGLDYVVAAVSTWWLQALRMRVEVSQCKLPLRTVPHIYRHFKIIRSRCQTSLILSWGLSILLLSSQPDFSKINAFN